MEDSFVVVVVVVVVVTVLLPRSNNYNISYKLKPSFSFISQHVPSSIFSPTLHYYNIKSLF
jgi:hypothetical protein